MLGVKPKLFVQNKLSTKPQQAVNRLRNFVEKQEIYNMSMRQDYSKNLVELNLIGRSLDETGKFFVYQTRYLPVNTATKAYTKTAKEMIQAEKEAYTPAKKSLLTRLMETIGL